MIRFEVQENLFSHYSVYVYVTFAFCLLSIIHSLAILFFFLAWKHSACIAQPYIHIILQSEMKLAHHLQHFILPLFLLHLYRMMSLHLLCYELGNVLDQLV